MQEQKAQLCIAVCLEDRRTECPSPASQYAAMSFVNLFIRKLLPKNTNIKAISGCELESELWKKDAHVVFIQNAPLCQASCDASRSRETYLERLQVFLFEHSQTLLRDACKVFPLHVILFSEDPNKETALEAYSVFGKGQGLPVQIHFMKFPADLAEMEKLDPLEPTVSLSLISNHQAINDTLLLQPENIGSTGKPIAWKVLSIDDDWSPSSKRDAFMSNMKRVMSAGLGINNQNQVGYGCLLSCDNTTAGCKVPTTALCCVNFPSSGDVALLRELLEHKCPDVDVIFLDVMDDGKSSNDDRQRIKARERLRELIGEVSHFRELAALPLVVVLSSLRAPEVAHIAMRSGADYYWNKRQFLLQSPVSLGQIIPECIMNRHGVPVDVDLPALHAIDKEKRVGVVESALKNAVEVLLADVLNRSRTESKATLKRICGDGRGGAVTAFWELSDCSGSLASVVRLVKYASQDAMLSERENYLRYIAGVIDNYCGRVEGFIPCRALAEQVCWPESYARHGVICYTVAGAPDDELFNLDKYLMQCKAEAPGHLSKLMDSLIRSVLKPLHQPQKKQREGAPSIFGWFKGCLPSVAVVACLQDGRICIGAHANEVVGKTMVVEIEEVGVDRAEDERVNLEIKVVVVCPPACYPKLEGLKLNLLLNQVCTDELGPRWLLRRRKRFEVFFAELQGWPEWLSFPVNGQNEGIWDNPALYFRPDKLMKLIEEGKVPEDTAISVIGRVLGQYGKDLKKWVSAVESARSILDSNREGYGIVHGDLNPGNILVSTKDNLCWLTDFARTRPGYGIYDIVKLEVDLRTHVFARVIEPRALSQKYDDLCGAISAFEEELWQDHAVACDWPIINYLLQSEERSVGFCESKRILASAADVILQLRRGYLENKNSIDIYKGLFMLYSARCCAYANRLADKEPNSALELLWPYLAAQVVRDMILDSSKH